MLSVLAVVACLAVASATPAPVVSYAEVENTLPGSYLIMYHADAGEHFRAAQSLAKSQNIRFRYAWDFEQFHAFAADLNSEELEIVRQFPGINYIEVDQVGHVAGEQEDATWGLDRVDQRELPLDTLYKWDDARMGLGVLAYILDTGIHTDHEDFNGRAKFGSCHPANDPNCEQDCQGHGTHVAGTVGATTYGVAKNVSMIGVKVCQRCSGSCTLSEVINGIEWTHQHHKSNRKRKLSVLNMSLQFRKSDAMNEALAAASAAGVVPVVAASNYNQDACNFSPASAPAAITVGASDVRDAKASFSSWGTCVDIWAPGVSVVSLANRNSGTASMSGTSMASPHVCGAAALIASGDEADSTEAVREELKSTATKDAVTGLPRGDNLLLYNNHGQK